MHGMQNGYAGYHTASFAAAALTETEIASLAKEAGDKANAVGTPVTEVVNIFRLIADRADQDTVALRAAVLAPSKGASIQASLVLARVQTPIVAPVVATPVVTPAKFSRKAKIGIGVGIGVALAIGAAVGVGVMHARSR
jgi:hypothetical protein